MSRKGKQSRSGHYCWACDRQRPNENFSGRGHSRHLCRECAKLGAEELAYRQALNDLDRCFTWEGFLRRKQRKNFERFLLHADLRIRAAAQEMLEEDDAAHRSARQWDEDEERRMVDAPFDEYDESDALPAGDHDIDQNDDEAHATDLPF